MRNLPSAKISIAEKLLQEAVRFLSPYVSPYVSLYVSLYPSLYPSLYLSLWRIGRNLLLLFRRKFSGTAEL